MRREAAAVPQGVDEALGKALRGSAAFLIGTAQAKRMLRRPPRLDAT